MYVRLTGGRDRGHTQDILEEVAREMLASGAALPVDFTQPNPLEFKELLAPLAHEIPAPTPTGMREKVAKILPRKPR